MFYAISFEAPTTSNPHANLEALRERMKRLASPADVLDDFFESLLPFPEFALMGVARPNKRLVEACRRHIKAACSLRVSMSAEIVHVPDHRFWHGRLRGAKGAAAVNYFADLDRGCLQIHRYGSGYDHFMYFSLTERGMPRGNASGPEIPARDATHDCTVAGRFSKDGDATLRSSERMGSL
jgi:hypothetical protein